MAGLGGLLSFMPQPVESPITSGRGGLIDDGSGAALNYPACSRRAHEDVRIAYAKLDLPQEANPGSQVENSSSRIGDRVGFLV